ncbi:hypothetical protein [Micromonospora parathelypteridis]|uniref:PknH-like extracellular domain-containing protein n=1 Tax=Micromonospora parathelypteridis TaxID=1839617 RepID=A0A840W5P7_9ACTN|nr:hypothetical protein [Micromonospora parathelypteridis]MBB5480080.1 hypothetical protein [Micromonospora parathelypteridis]GGO25110.1 hypothetical protein GCM10011576_47320 [Micromonospora parathelypteridis]
MSQYAPLPPARMRNLLALVPLVGAIAVATACTATSDPSDSASPTAAPTSAAAAVDPTAPPSPSASTQATIPTSAFVELPSELRKSPRRTTPVEEALPKLCANEFGTGGRQVTASAAMTVTYKKAGDSDGNTPQGMIHQTIFTFDGDGASAYMGRLRTAVQACPSYDHSGSPGTVKSQALPGVGDEALLLTRTWLETSLNGERTGNNATSQIAVARVDNAVTVFDDQGWEGTSGNAAILDRVVRDGVKTLDAWQR